MLEKDIVRSTFGIITSVKSDADGSLYITNENGHKVKMSNKNKKWFRQIPAIKEKCNEYTGKKSISSRLKQPSLGNL